jgi:heme-degrading monooxygenase HmoA
MSHVVIWEFLVRAGAESEFERVYGSQGDWAQLFSRSEGYRRTDLLRDREQSGRYVVLDHWHSAEHYQRFRTTHESDYRALDKRCESLTTRETPLGTFSSID